MDARRLMNRAEEGAGNVCGWNFENKRRDAVGNRDRRPVVVVSTDKGHLHPVTQVGRRLNRIGYSWREAVELESKFSTG